MVIRKLVKLEALHNTSHRAFQPSPRHCDWLHIDIYLDLFTKFFFLFLELKFSSEALTWAHAEEKAPHNNHHPNEIWQSIIIAVASKTAASERALPQAWRRLKITRRESGHCVSPSISVAHGVDFFSRHCFERNPVIQGGCVRGAGEEEVVRKVSGGKTSTAAANDMWQRDL